MELRAVRKLEEKITAIGKRLAEARKKQAELASALRKSKAETDKLKTRVERYKSERSRVRRKVDSMLKRFEKLGLGAEQA